MTNSFAGMSMDAPPAAPSHHTASAPDPIRPLRKNEPPARPPPPSNVPTIVPQGAPQGAPNPYAGAPGPLPYPTQPGAMPMPYAAYTPMTGIISIFFDGKQKLKIKSQVAMFIYKQTYVY